MRYYYEMNDGFADIKKGKYLTTLSDKYRVNKVNLLWYADRVWKEGEGNIKFIKNRFTGSGDLSESELEEFVWVKLKCKHV